MNPDETDVAEIKGIGIVEKDTGPTNEDIPLKIFVPNEEPIAKLPVVRPDPKAIVPVVMLEYKDTRPDIEDPLILFEYINGEEIEDDKVIGPWNDDVP